MTHDRAAFVRDSMRASWGGRTAQYADVTAGNTDRYAAVLLELVDLRPGERVLDVATGPGVVSIAAARAVGATGEVVATDLAAEWGEMVASSAAQSDLTNVSFQATSADALQLPDASFDVALCQFGLMLHWRDGAIRLPSEAIFVSAIR